MPTDSFTSALAQLDPANRALLDLSLRRGMRPDEISELLGTDTASVIVAREQALGHLADELGLDDAAALDDMRARLAELPPESWTGPRAPLPQVEAIMEEAEAEERPRAARAAGPPPIKRTPTPQRGKSRLPLLLTLLAIAAVVLVIFLATSGGDDEGSTGAEPNTPAATPPKPAAKAAPGKPARSAPKPPQPAAGAKVELAGLGGSSAKGTANLLDGGKRLRLDISGLSAGTYQVWLYNSIIDSRSLTQARGTTLALDLQLPANASHYKFVDISLEGDANPNHSGQSVARVPLAKLSR